MAFYFRFYPPNKVSEPSTLIHTSPLLFDLDNRRPGGICNRIITRKLIHTIFIRKNIPIKPIFRKEEGESGESSVWEVAELQKNVDIGLFGFFVLFVFCMYGMNGPVEELAFTDGGALMIT